MNKQRFTLFLRKFILCLLIACIAYIPLCNGSIVMGSDTSFHIARIESLYLAAKEGQWFPGVFWNQNYGYGYGSPLFYSCFFLYIPVLFRFLGFSMISSYRLFLLVIFFFTAFTMYSLAEKVMPHKHLAIFFSAFLYEFCLYVYSDTLNRGAIGEALAYVFIPVVLQGLWAIFYKRQKGWFALVIGLSSLLLSHNISFFLVCAFLILYALAHIKTLFQHPKMLFILLLAAFLSFGLTLFFSLPMLEQLQSNIYRVSTYFNDSLTDGTTLLELFSFIPYDHDHLGLSVGLQLTLLPLAGFFTKKKNRFVKEMTICGYLCLWMTTSLFPWKWFPFMSFLQFPHRFFTICSAFLALASGYAFAYLPLKKKYKKRTQQCLLLYSAFIVFLQVKIQFDYDGVFYTDTDYETLIQTDLYWSDREGDWYNLMELSTPDYLPSDIITNFTTDKRIITHEDMIDSVFEEENGKMSWKYDGGGIYYYPKTWYKGYIVTVEYNDEVLYTTDTVIDEESGNVCFELPSGLPEDAIVVLQFEGSALRKICFQLSFVFLLIVLIGYLISKVKFSFTKTQSSVTRQIS